MKEQTKENQTGKNILSVRQLQLGDIEPLVHYWVGSENTFLEGMGVDLNKLPGSDEITSMLTEQINTPLEDKNSYCIIWQLDGKAIGHSNVNKIIFGEEAYMHLHLWNQDTRLKGLGTTLVRMTLPFFFEDLKLKNLYCEPYALNPSPNKTLNKVGFDFIKNYVTTPNALSFEQPVNRWILTLDKFKQMREI